MAFVLNTKISHISYPSWRAFLGSRLVAICNQHPFNCERAKVGINAVPSACISCSTSSAQSQKSGRMLQQMQKTAANFRSGSTAGVRAPVLPSPKLRQRFHTSRRAVEEGTGPAVKDLDEAVEAFMKRQAELESGAAFARTKNPAEVIGADVVDDEAAKAYCREVVRILRTLKAKRDMSVNEARLIVSIEDPRTREQRQLGIEDERGVSRDEMAAALLEVAEGRVPRDRLALKCLLEDMQSWPFLDADDAAAAADALASGGGSSSSRAGSNGSSSSSQEQQRDAIVDDATGIVRPYIMGKEARKGDEPQTLTDMLPDWVGYGTLYGISVIPVLLVVGTVLILFYNSLK